MIGMKKFSESITLRIAIILFCVFCVIVTIGVRFKYNDYLKEISDKQMELDRIEEEVAELEREYEKPFDKDYIIRIAKDKLGLRLPPEIIFYNGD